MVIQWSFRTWIIAFMASNSISFPSYHSSNSYVNTPSPKLLMNVLLTRLNVSSHFIHSYRCISRIFNISTLSMIKQTVSVKIKIEKVFETTWLIISNSYNLSYKDSHIIPKTYWLPYFHHKSINISTQLKLIQNYNIYIKLWISTKWIKSIWIIEY